MKKQTEKTLWKAGHVAIMKMVDDKSILACSENAGFVIPRGQKRGQRTGYQVFVTVCRWDEDLMKQKPNTGGLLKAL